jgi:hypothetical protein
MVGWGSGTVIVAAGVGFPPCRRLVAPRTAGTVIVTISASPPAAAIASKAPDRSGFRNFLPCFLARRGGCGVITPSIVDLGIAHRRRIERCSPAPALLRDGSGADAIAWHGRSILRPGNSS